MAALMTAQDVAARWQCSAAHVRRQAREGRLSGVRLGADWRFSLASVEAFEAAATTAPEKAQSVVAAPVRVLADLPADYAPVFPELWAGHAASPAAARGRSTAKRKRA